VHFYIIIYIRRSALISRIGQKQKKTRCDYD